MMITATFRGIELSRHMTINEITGRGITPSSVSTIDLPGMVGVYVGAKKRLARTIEINYTIEASSLNDLRVRINELSVLLDTDGPGELKFSDEPGVVYFAILDGVPDSTEIRTISQGTLTFLCPDPYKYSDSDRRASLKASSTTEVRVSGTSRSEPVFEITALKSASSLSIQNQAGQTMTLGAPSTIGSPSFNEDELILHAEGNSMVGWVPASTNEVNGTVDGNMSMTTGADADHKFYADRFKADPATVHTGWHGPAIKTQLAMAASDFTADVILELPNGTDPGKVGRVEYYLKDGGGNNLATVTVSDETQGSLFTTILVKIGTRTVFDSKSQGNVGVWNNFIGRIRVERRGSAWNIYVAKIHSDGAEHRRATATFNGGSTAPLAQVVLSTQAHSDSSTVDGAFRDVKVFRRNEPPVERAVPNIFKAGDKIVIDHRGRGAVTINGVDARKYKQLTAIPFKMTPGNNNITLLPLGSFSGTVKWREAYK